MKTIFVSQRVDIVRGERRDALDQKWGRFLHKTGVIALPIPNNPEVTYELLTAVPPDGILLSGGNNPGEYAGDAPERDMVDGLLIDYAIAHKIPLIGICRGMQSVLLHFGGSLKKASGHIGIRHEVKGRITRSVNSYHSLAADVVPSNLEVLAYTEDGIAEAVKHTTLPIAALMWHPEREESFLLDDIMLFKKIWNKKAGEI